MEETKTNDHQEKEVFTLDEILEMLDGTKYYSNDQIMYVYHIVNGRTDEAAPYKELCLEQVEKENKKYDSLKTELEIKMLNEEALKLEGNNDNSDEKLKKIKRH
jgi:hypothetical protein